MRLLVLTHTFPPSSHANAKRPGYIVKGFLEANWEVDVFTTSAGMYEARAETIVHPKLKIYRRSVYADVLISKASKNPALHRMVGLLLSGISWPDVFAKWVLGALADSKRHEPYDRVIAFILPASMLLSGVAGKRVGRKWTFDFQESITPHLRQHSRRSPLQKALRPILEKLERHTLHKAGHVVFTADTNRQAYIAHNLVHAERTAHIPYFYEETLFATAPPPLNPEFEIVYFGTFDWTGARSPETFLKSLAGFLRTRPEARRSTRFTFYGKWLPEHNALIDSLGLRDLVSIHAGVSYSEYILKLRASPILLLVVASAHNLFMPSKIVDYFGARRPILAFVPKGSEMDGLLGRAGMHDFVSDEFDANAGAHVLEELWKRHTAHALTIDASKTSHWSSTTQMRRYFEVLEDSGAGGVSRL